MNTKSLVFVVFAVWTAICWRWYVCGIMGACSPQDPIYTEQIKATPEEPTPINVPKEDTPEIQPIASDATNSGNTGQTSNAAKSASSDHMDQVQVVEVNDRMVIYYPYQTAQKE
jgi:hypothetical protein